MPKVKVNDINIYYERHGQGEPLILIGGFGADHTIWDSIDDIFSKHYEVIVFDNRGAGQTDVPMGAYTIEQLTKDVVSLCKALKITKAHFIGNSMGGYILQELACHYPSLVKSAIISNSTNGGRTCFHNYLEAQLELIKAEVPLNVLIKATCSWVYSIDYLLQPGILNVLIQEQLENPYPFTINGYEGQYAALKNFNSKQWLNKINVPTLVIGADQDLIFSELSIKALADNIPDAEYYCFQQCGHLPFIEYPEKFINVVLDFISKANTQIEIKYQPRQ